MKKIKNNIIGVLVGIIIVLCFFMNVLTINKNNKLQNDIVAQQEVSRKSRIEIESLKYFTTNGYNNKRIQNMKDGDIGWIYGVLIVGDSAYIKFGTLISNKYTGENPIMVVKESNRFIVDFTNVDKAEIEDRKYSLHSSNLKNWSNLRFFYISAFLASTR